MVSKIKSIKRRLKSTSLFEWIMLLRLFLGGYYHATSSKIWSFFLKLYCIFITVIMTSLYLINMPFVSPYVFLFFKLNFSTVLSIITHDEYLFKYCEFIKIADAIMGINKTSIITKESLILTMYIIIARIFVSTYYAVILLNVIENISSFICLNFVVFSTDIYYLTMIIIFALLYNRMKRLRKSLEMNSIPVNIIGNNEITTKIKHIRNSILYYNNLLNNVENVNRQVQFMLVITLLAAFPQMAMFSYLSVHSYFIGSFSELNVTNMFELLNIFVVISSPAVIVEMTISEVQKIKTTLVNRLLRCSDPALRFEIEIALDYVIRRPFKFVMLRVIPLDITFIFGIITMCITYIIVSIQLFHFMF